MPDAKGVEGSPMPRPSLRAAANLKRPFRKPTDGPAPSGPGPAPAVRHAGSAARRLRLPPQPGAQLSGQPGRHLRLPEPDPAHEFADGPDRGRPDPAADREPGQFRADAD